MVECIFCMYKVVSSNLTISKKFYFKMKKNIERDNLKRYAFNKKELDIFVIKTLLKSYNIPFLQKRVLRWCLNVQYKQVLLGKSTMRRICIITGKNRGIFRKWSFSRFQVKKYSSLGLIPGISKRGW